MCASHRHLHLQPVGALYQFVNSAVASIIKLKPSAGIFVSLNLTHKGSNDLKELNSQTCGEIIPGALVEILEDCTMGDGTVRARTADGWVTLSKEKSNPRSENLRKLSDVEAVEAEQMGATASALGDKESRWDRLARPRTFNPGPDLNVGFYDLSIYTDLDAEGRPKEPEEPEPRWKGLWPREPPLKLKHADEFEIARIRAYERRK